MIIEKERNSFPCPYHFIEGDFTGSHFFFGVSGKDIAIQKIIFTETFHGRT
jgi:hypothetical protein